MKNNVYSYDTISRFELVPNSTDTGAQNAFSIYGVLIIPMLLGGILLYHVFELKAMFFWVSISLLAIILINIYVFYKRTMFREQILKIIIDGSYIQMIKHQDILFQAQIEDVSVKMIRCGEQGYLAIEMTNEDLSSFIIGLQESFPQNDHKISRPLTQPNYWIRNKNEWQYLYQQIKKKSRSSQVVFQ